MLHRGNLMLMCMYLIDIINKTACEPACEPLVNLQILPVYLFEMHKK